MDISTSLWRSRYQISSLNVVMFCMRIINHDWLRTGPGTVMSWSCPKAPSDVLIISAAKNMQQGAKTVMGNNICNVLSVKILYKKENLLLRTLSQQWPFEWFVFLVDGVSVSFEFVVKSPMGGVFSWQMTREQCQSQCQPHVCTSSVHSPAQDTWTQARVPPFYCNSTFKGFPKSKIQKP